MTQMTIGGRSVGAAMILAAGLIGVLGFNPSRANAQNDGRVFALIAIDTDSHIAGMDANQRRDKHGLDPRLRYHRPAGSSCSEGSGSLA